MSTQTPLRTESSVPPRDSRHGGAAALGLVLIAAGLLWLLAALGVELPVAVVAPVVLVVLGVGVLVMALRGEDNAAVGFAVFVGVWLAIGSIVTSVVGVPLSGDVGERNVVPVAVAELDDGYRQFAGSQVFDLRGLELPDGTTELDLSTVLGEVEVIVPSGMAVEVDAAVAGGSIDLFGRVSEGLGLGQQERTDGFADASARLDLQLRVGLGSVVVRAR